MLYNIVNRDGGRSENLGGGGGGGHSPASVIPGKATIVYCFYGTAKMPIQYTLKDLETKITIHNHQLTAKVSC